MKCHLPSRAFGNFKVILFILAERVCYPSQRLPELCALGASGVPSISPGLMEGESWRPSWTAKAPGATGATGATGAAGVAGA